MPVSNDEQIKELIDFSKAMEMAVPLICLMQSKGMAPMDIAMVGSLITGFCYPSVLPGREETFLQVNLDVVQQCGPGIQEQVDIMNAAVNEAKTPPDMLDLAFGPMDEDVE